MNLSPANSRCSPDTDCMKIPLDIYFLLSTSFSTEAQIESFKALTLVPLSVFSLYPEKFLSDLALNWMLIAVSTVI